MTIVVYTDGACRGNPGPGGWAWAVPAGPFAAGPAAHTTNQRMEIEAALEAVRANGSGDESVEIVSDSTYVVNCFRDRWWEGWRKRGWLNSQKKPVANRDVWEPLVDLVEERGNVRFRWVKGHSGDLMNDFVDELAVEASLSQRARAGSPSPGGSGESGGSASSAAPRVASVHAASPEFHDVLVIGHADREVASVQGALAVLIADRFALEPRLRVVTGLRRGAETLAAEVAKGEGVPVMAVLPFPDPAADWPEEDQARFHELRAFAERAVVLQDVAPSSAQGAAAALRRRDAWLGANVSDAVVVWDGVDERVGRLHRSLVDSLGEDRVVVLTPNP